MRDGICFLKFCQSEWKKLL